MWSEVSEPEVKDTAHRKDERWLVEPATFRRDQTGGWLGGFPEERWRWADLYLLPDRGESTSDSERADADLQHGEFKENMEALP